MAVGLSTQSGPGGAGGLSSGAESPSASVSVLNRVQRVSFLDTDLLSGRSTLLVRCCFACSSVSVVFRHRCRV